MRSGARTSESYTLREFESEIIEDYEIVIEWPNGTAESSVATEE